ncbi:MAG TPA: CHAT domain-containing tetratricopeptide repeat protein [Myxococcaceae bacterium]|nr:CHAT domain-containing tetratricopeptide repeat protein [Myxococcaceae bacterium]
MCLSPTLLAVACTALAAAQDAGMDPRLAEAQAASDKAVMLKDAGRYAEAIPEAERALVAREAVLGKDHLLVAQSLHLLATLDDLQGLYRQAVLLFQRALAIREASLGKEHPDVAASLHGLATVYVKQDLAAQALPLFERALAIREAALGKNHADVAQSLGALGDFYVTSGHPSQAEPLFQRALAIQEVALGKDHPDVAQSLMGLAALYTSQRQLNRVEPLLQRALTIREAALGKDHPDVARTLYDLGDFYCEQGLFARAEVLYQRALAIREKALGRDHPDVGESLNELGMLHYSQGSFGRAEPLLQRSLAILEASMGRNHHATAVLLNNLASLYREQGSYDRAETLFQQALAIREAAFGKDHPVISQALSNLGSLYREQGSYDRAEPLLQRALVIREAFFGKNHPGVAITLNQLAGLYRDQGLYDRAEPLFQRALAIRETALGKDHPTVVQSLNDLALLYLDRDQYRRAEPLFERALAVEGAALDENHPEVVKSLNGLGQLRLRQGWLAEAVRCFVRALAISEGRLRREALDFSESRLSSFLHLLDRDAQRLYSLASAHPERADVRRLALTSALLFKGRSVEETADTSRTILRSMGAQDRDAFERLRGLRTQFAKLSLGGPGGLSPAGYQQRLKGLADEGDALEADLARRSAPLRAGTELPSTAEVVDRVAAALPADGALVELVVHGEPSRFLALVLFPDGRTAALDLGPADAVDRAASKLRDAFAGESADFRSDARQMYRLAFQPLLRVLGTTRKVFLAPDGQLSLVPFDALHDGRRFLAEAFDFTYLTSGRDLLPRPAEIHDASSVVVLADPDYGASPSNGGATPAAAERSYSVERFFAGKRGDISGRRWAPLPGTRQEAEAIQHLLPQAQLFVGAGASKERLLGLATPGILHIATHGFFLEDAAPAPDSGKRGVAEVGPLPRPADPLLRSGLVLAGAGGPASDPGDSLVTALELAGLNLWGTELVVLSACDTGQGEVRRGQGVYGLRRALVVAGAETMVVSLWKVDDETTRTMMERYYRNLLAGQGRASALKAAMLSLRAQHSHPHSWAPFIAIGANTPLRGFAPPLPKP